MSKIRLFKVISDTDRILEKLRPVFDSGYVGQGPAVETFEKMLGDVIGRRPVAVNSCTSALELALELCGATEGTEVITPPIGCTASVAAIISRGARPVWCDVDPLTGLALPGDINKKVTPRTRAILTVDWGGAPCDYDEIRTLNHGIPIIEDAAHALMTTYHGGPVAATGGDFVCYSFQAIKHLNTVDGGAIVTPPNGDYFRRAKLLRWFGLDRESTTSFRCGQNIKESGFKWQPNDVLATVGICNLPLAIEAVAASRKTSLFYSRTIETTDAVYQGEYNPDSSYWIHTILVENRNGFMEYMAERGIETSPVHARINKHDCYNFPNGPLPGVDYFDSAQVSIPNGVWVTEEEQEHIVTAVNNWRG